MIRALFPTIMIVASLGLFFVYTKPTYEKAVSVRKDESAYNEALDNAREYRTIQENLATSMRSINPDQVDRLKKMLPDTVDNVRLVIDLESLAVKHNLVFKSVQYDADKNSDTPKEGALPIATPNSESLLPYGSLDFKIIIKGGYADFLSFLQDLEKSLRIVDVVSIGFNAPVELDSTKKDSSVPQYEYTIDLTAYWLKN